MDNLFNFGLTATLLGFSFVQTALLAAAVLGLVAGMLGPLIVMRRMSFAVHGTAELAFTGPAAAAARITASPWKATVLTVIFAETAALGGIVLSLAPGAPVSAFVTTISFTIYAVCRLIAYRRDRAAKVTSPGVRPVSSVAH